MWGHNGELPPKILRVGKILKLIEMKDLKLNKLADNRLNEKEMRDLIGGESVTYIYTVVCSKDNLDLCCNTMCACTFHPPLLEAPTASNGASDGGAAMKLREIAIPLRLSGTSSSTVSSSN